MAENRRAFGQWLHRRDRVSNDRYREQRVVVKRAIKVVKRITGWRWGEESRNDFEDNKNMFLKDVTRVGQCEQGRDDMVKDVNGQKLRHDVEVLWRWEEYFEQVLNVGDVREADINVVGDW